MGNHEAVGAGSAKKEARQLAAQNMLALLEQDDEMASNASSECSYTSATVAAGAAALVPPILENQTIDTANISKLINICKEYLLQMPRYAVVLIFFLNSFQCIRHFRLIDCIFEFI